MNLESQTITSDKDIVARYALVWVVMIFVAIFNAILRESVFGTFLSPLGAHQFSSITAVFLFLFVTYLFSKRWPINSSKQAIIIGVMWVILTPLFEFSFGLLVMGHSLDYLLNDYNLFAGRVWGLVLLSIALAPYIVHKIRGGKSR